MSFGTAGSLDPGYAPGTVVVAMRIIAPDGTVFPTDAAWRQALLASVRRAANVVATGAAGADTPFFDPAAKQSLGRRTGAAVVDMESHAVARIASERGLPFLAVRAVADPCHRQVPEWLPAILKADGSADLTRLAFGLLRRPWDVAPLVRLGFEYRCALRALRRVALHAGPDFQFPG